MVKNKKVLLRNSNSTRPWQHALEAIVGYLQLAASIKKNKRLHGEVFNFGPNNTKNSSFLEYYSTSCFFGESYWI